MAIVRWQPSRSLSPTRSVKDDLECFLEDVLGYRASTGAIGFSPRVDLRDTPESFIVSAEVPGVDKDGLDLSVEADHVLIKGERKAEEVGEGECYYCRESSGGTFERTIVLPQPVVAEQAEAKLANGILTLVLPKAQPRTSVKVTVN